jgi:hypothetical protein
MLVYLFITRKMISHFFLLVQSEKEEKNRCHYKLYGHLIIIPKKKESLILVNIINSKYLTIEYIWYYKKQSLRATFFFKCV